MVEPAQPTAPVFPVAQANLGVVSTQPAEPISSISGHPEVKSDTSIPHESGIELVSDVEVIPEAPKIPPELEEHVEAVTRGEIQLPGPIEAGIHEGQPVTIQPAAQQQPRIVLPISKSDFAGGSAQPTSTSWRWLVEWVKRIILKYPGRAVYQER